MTPSFLRHHAEEVQKSGAASYSVVTSKTCPVSQHSKLAANHMRCSGAEGKTRDTRSAVTDGELWKSAAQTVSDRLQLFELHLLTVSLLTEDLLLHPLVTLEWTAHPPQLMLVSHDSEKVTAAELLSHLSMIVTV